MPSSSRRLSALGWITSTGTLDTLTVSLKEGFYFSFLSCHCKIIQYVSDALLRVKKLVCCLKSSPKSLLIAFQPSQWWRLQLHYTLLVRWLSTLAAIVFLSLHCHCFLVCVRLLGSGKAGDERKGPGLIKQSFSASKMGRIEARCMRDVYAKTPLKTSPWSVHRLSISRWKKKSPLQDCLGVNSCWSGMTGSVPKVGRSKKSRTLGGYVESCHHFV